jgi:hypothetical protein
MKRTLSVLLATIAAVLGVAVSQSASIGRTNGASAPFAGIKIFPDYRDWKLVSVAHEEGNLNDIRAILGNDIAIKAFRKDRLPLPDGAVIARIAWKDIPSEENNKVFGRPQSFVAGPAPEWYLQFMVKDSKKYAATGGWGFAQFNRPPTNQISRLRLYSLRTLMSRCLHPRGITMNLPSLPSI